MEDNKKESATQDLGELESLKPSKPVLDPKTEAEMEGNWIQYLKQTEQPSIDNHNPTTMSVSPSPPPSIISYFGLPAGANVSGETRALLGKIGKIVLSDAADSDEFFSILRSAERRLPRLSDPKRRMERMVDVLQGLKWHGSVKQALIDRGDYHIDEAEETARQTGNWSQFLKMAERHEKAVR